MKKILFVIAMEKEAKEIAKKLNLTEIKNDIVREKFETIEIKENYNNYPKIFTKNNISLLITGIGKQQTAINLTKYLENNKNNLPDVIINMGYAGSTNTQIGTWVNVNKSYNYEWNIPGEQRYEIEGFEQEKLKNIDAPIKHLPCYSAESFVTSTDIKEDVVFDMELHSIYLICCMYGIDLISLKKVSDNLNLDDYYKNIDMKDVMELTSGLNFLENSCICDEFIVK